MQMQYVQDDKDPAVCAEGMCHLVKPQQAALENATVRLIVF
jgi:hypothetical protein